MCISAFSCRLRSGGRSWSVGIRLCRTLRTSADIIATVAGYCVVIIVWVVVVAGARAQSIKLCSSAGRVGCGVRSFTLGMGDKFGRGLFHGRYFSSG